MASKVVSVKRQSTVGLPQGARPREQGCRSNRDHLSRLSRSEHGHLPLDQSECGSFVTKTHIDQRQIANQLIVFWLLDFTEP
jgi:hypothetical protein